MFGSNTTLQIVINARDQTSRVLKRVQNQMSGFARRAASSIGGRVSNAVTNLRGKLDSLVPTMQSIRMGASIAFGAMVFGIAKVVEAAGRAQEIEKQFQATFDKTEDMMRDWVATTSERLGRAESDIKKLAATAAGTLIPAFDMSERAVAKMTQDLSIASFAMTAYDNRIDNAQQAMTGFTQALIGNRQRVLEWGFQIGESQLKQKAYQRGLTNTERSLSAQEEALLSYKLIMENTDLSMNALVKSTLAYKEQQRRLKADIREAAESLGNTLRPAITQAFGSLRDMLKGITDWVSQNPDFVRAIASGATAFFGMALAASAVGLALRALMAHPIIALLSLIAASVVTARAQFTQLASDVGGLRNAFTLLGKHLLALWAEISTFVLEKINTIVKHVPFIGSAFDEAVQVAKKGARKLREDFNRTTIEMQRNADKTSESTKGMSEEMKLAQAAIEDLNNIDISKFFDDAAQAAGDAQQKLRGFNKEAQTAVSDFLETDKKKRTSMAEEIVKQEKEVARLEERLSEKGKNVKTQDNLEEFRSTRNKLQKERAALQRIKNQELVTEKRITKARERLNKTEFERKIMRLKKERKQAEKTLQEELARISAEREAVIGSNTQIEESEQQLTDRIKEEEQERTKTTQTEVNKRIQSYNALKRATANANSISTIGLLPGANTGNVTSVGDAVITPQGKVIRTNPNDFLFATKNPGGGGVTVNINGGTFLSEDSAEQIGDMIIDRLKQNVRI